MLLAIDIGNSNVSLGVFDGESLTQSWRLATRRDCTADELGILVTQLFAHRHLDLARVDGIIISSVVPPLTGTMADMALRYFGQDALMVDFGVDIGIPVLYENPAEVGPDRLVNGLAGFELYGRPRQAPVIVVDFGTATTFDAISVSGEYLGGVICPGIQISADALFQRAARLPRIDVRQPDRVIGRTTVASMQSGLFFGQVAMVEGIVGRMRRELAADERVSRGATATCVATGGIARLIAAEASVVEDVNLDLTLRGLRIAWERSNRRAAGS